MFHIYDKIRDNGIYIIAEMSANHGGKLENALEIVRESARAGADCVKIQTYTADSMTINCDTDDFIVHGGLWDGYKLYDLYTDACTPYDWQPRIKAECEKCDIDFLSTPFDPKAVDFLESFGTEAYKIASFELVDVPLIEYAASKGKPMIISCGMGTVEEIQDAINACYRVGNDQIFLLKCCSEYPSNWDDMNLLTIPDMKNRFNCPIGLSDHSEGSIGAVVGVSLGAQVIEKHVKLDGVESPDSGFSMPMDDFAKMVEDVRKAVKVRGKVKYGPNPGEAENLKLRRSLFVVKDMKAGDVITEENVRSIRPATGLAPRYWSEIEGKRVNRKLKKGTPLSMNFVEGQK